MHKLIAVSSIWLAYVVPPAAFPADAVECAAAGKVISRPAESPPSSHAVAAGDLYVEPATLHSLGFEWQIVGDENRNAQVRVRYRQVGSEDWQTGMDLLRIQGEKVDPGEDEFICPNLFAGSILFLKPSTRYEVQLRLTDPDGGDCEQLIRVPTKSEPAVWADGRKLHVYVSGFAGQRQTPAFEQIAAAYQAAGPGDQILLHAGEYLQPPLALDKQNPRDKPLVIRAAGDGPVTLVSAPGGDARATVFQASGGSHHWIEGVTIRGAYAGIEGGERDPVVGLTVRRCEFVDCGWAGVMLAGGHNRDIYLADNVFRPSQFTWQVWKKGVTPQFPYKGVWIAGQGVDVCHNLVVGSKDGISVHQPSSRPQAAGFAQKHVAIDFYHNDVRQMSDDNEADGGHHNIRFFHNRFVDQYVGFSAQPVYGGPCYLVRNVLHNIVRGTALKFNLQPAGVVVLHNTFVGGSSANRNWSNCHLHNNLFLAGDSTRATFEAGPLDPGISRISHNGFQVAGPVIWHGPHPKFAGQLRPDKRIQTLDDLERQGVATHLVEVGFDDFVALKRPGGIEHPNLDGQIGDARLKPNSAAVDAGLNLANVSDGFTGQAPDLGAYELGLPLPHYGPRPASPN